MGWSTTTTYFVNINTSLLPHVESLGPLRFRKRPQLCLTLLTNACSQQDHVTWLRKWNSTVPQLSQALFRVLKLQLCPEKAETGEHNSTDWNRWTARSDPGGSDPFTTRAGKVSGNGKRADHICPKKEKKKNTAKTLLWLQTLHTSFNHNNQGLVQNNAMIECCRPRTSSTPIVHVRTAQ